ncbi:MAG: fibronectin type III domain-containing protein [Lachnospiraceae bacterium]|nr:fibronectin type III domain-containing protein [Lachnospiraceae bacterium]
MKKKCWIKKAARVFAGLLLLVTMLASVPLEAQAASNAIYSYGSAVSVPGSGAQITADTFTFNGKKVSAVYKKYGTYTKSDKTYCCAAYVTKFYKTVYGVNVSSLDSIKSVPKCNSGSFSSTKNPVPGDIVRWNKSVHWSIVKSVSGDRVTLIQQNYWNSAHTAALKNVVISKTNGSFTFFHWSGYYCSDIPKASVSFNIAAFTYDRTAHKPAVTVKEAYTGKTLAANTDYTVSFPGDQINAGTKTVTIKGKGRYSGTISKTYRITPAFIGGCTSTLKAQTYTGKARNPVFAVKDGKYTLKKDVDYTVTYENSKNIGYARAVVVGKGNYAGTTVFAYAVNPAAMAAPTLKTTASAKRTTITVTWKKAPGSVSGYEISYRKSGSGSWKTVKVSGGSKTSYQITSGLSRLTKYDVRVRAYKTVGNATFYGSWSGTKTVRTPVLK